MVDRYNLSTKFTKTFDDATQSIESYLKLVDRWRLTNRVPLQTAITVALDGFKNIELAVFVAKNDFSFFFNAIYVFVLRNKRKIVGY